MPNIWSLYAEEVLGYMPKMTVTNEEYVTAVKVQRWLNAGYTAGDIALLWNQGHLGECSSGRNDYGVWYDSCAYREKVLLVYYQ